MQLTPEIISELNVLTMFNPDTTLEGIKIHSTADENIIAAGKRLFDRGLISQSDGGYLTGLGITAVEHSNKLLQILS